HRHRNIPQFSRRGMRPAGGNGRFPKTGGPPTGAARTVCRRQKSLVSEWSQLSAACACRDLPPVSRLAHSKLCCVPCFGLGSSVDSSLFSFLGQSATRKQNSRSPRSRPARLVRDKLLL